MALIHCTALVGFPKKLAGNATLISPFDVVMVLRLLGVNVNIWINWNLGFSVSANGCCNLGSYCCIKGVSWIRVRNDVVRVLTKLVMSLVENVWVMGRSCFWIGGILVCLYFCYMMLQLSTSLGHMLFFLNYLQSH